MDENQLKEEIKLFKEYFSGQEGLLKSIRSLLIGLDVSDADKERIKSIFAKKEVRDIVRRRIYQLDTDDVPLGAMNDLWMGLDSKIQGASPDAVIQAIIVRKNLVDLFTNIDSYLQDPFQPKIDLKITQEAIEVANADKVMEIACDIIARNMYIKAVDMVLAIIHNLTQNKEETPDEAVKRIKKDSTR